MKPNTLFFWEFLLFDFAALGWGAWEYFSVRRDSASPPPALPPETSVGATDPDATPQGDTSSRA